MMICSSFSRGTPCTRPWGLGCGILAADGRSSNYCKPSSSHVKFSDNACETNRTLSAISVSILYYPAPL